MALLASVAIAETVAVDPNAPIQLTQDGQRSSDKAEVRLHGSLAEKVEAAEAAGGFDPALHSWDGPGAFTGTSASAPHLAGTATRLSFDVQPSETKLNQSVTPAITVQVLDSNGNVVTDDNSTEVELAFAVSPGGATLSGGGPVTVASGEALFDAVSIDEVGQGYQLEATDTGGALDPDTSVSFDIIPGDPAKFSFVVQPSDGISGNPIEPAVEVEVLDADGNRVTWDNATSIRLQLSGGSGGTLSGGGPLTVTDGLAVFDSLIVDQAGSDYRLDAVDPDGRVSSDNSSLFDIIDDEVFNDRFEDASP